jgi:hypothetical protein
MHERAEPVLDDQLLANIKQGRLALLWGKVGGLDACEGAYAPIEPLPRISLTDLF